MGKRSNFQRRPKDFYPTPEEAILPLLGFLKENTKYTEPCVGDFTLVKHLLKYGHECVLGFDDEEDATKSSKFKGEIYITNPPWDRKILHPIIENLIKQAPCWLLFDADWIHTKQSVPFLPYLKIIQSVGRIKWIPNSKMTGKDNCAWYYFSKEIRENPIQFYGRAGNDKRYEQVRCEGTASVAA